MFHAFRCTSRVMSCFSIQIFSITTYPSFDTFVILQMTMSTFPIISPANVQTRNARPEGGEHNNSVCLILTNRVRRETCKTVARTEGRRARLVHPSVPLVLSQTNHLIVQHFLVRQQRHPLLSKGRAPDAPLPMVYTESQKSLIILYSRESVRSMGLSMHIEL